MSCQPRKSSTAGTSTRSNDELSATKVAGHVAVTMSWFDTKQLTSLAKSALSEAQKTLDKALDIKEDGGAVENVPAESSMSASKMWGSFTGSFFDSTQVAATSTEGSAASDVVSMQPHSPGVVVAAPRLSISSNEEQHQQSLPRVESAVMQEVEVDLPEVAESLLATDDSSSFSDVNNAGDGFSTNSLVSVSEDPSAALPVPMVSSQSEHDELSSSVSSSRTVTGATSSTNDLQACEASSVSQPVTLETADSTDAWLSADMTDSVQSQLDEAMFDQEKRSETSSSQSYEVVRESQTTSGQTSGDELETTATSSDIEVIASPTAGSSRCSPSPKVRGNGSNGANPNLGANGSRLLKEVASGHCRTGSEISVIGSEEGFQMEIDRLLKRMSDMNEMLDARESKIAELSKVNFELQEKNTDLTSQVKEAMKINTKLQEANDDFTRRMDAMEKRLQRTASEKEALLEENKKLNQESATRISQRELSDLVNEKDVEITELRREGESLSKQVGKHSEVIKKLRGKEKSNEAEIKALKAELENRNKEYERTKKSLGAKDEQESKQIEVIQSLTAANSKWEEQHNKVVSELEDAKEKLSGFKNSLEAAYRETSELRRGLVEKEGEAQELALSKELAAKQALQEQLRELQETYRLEKEELFRQIDELRIALSTEERTSARHEEALRRERSELLARLADSDHRHEELSSSMSSATRPLLRQIESLQASLNEAHAAAERVERSLSERLQQANIQLSASQERERMASEQYMQISAKMASIESKLASATRERARLEVLLKEETHKYEQLSEESTKSASVSEALQRSMGEEVSKLKRDLDFVEASLSSEKSEVASEKRKNMALAEQLRDRDKRLKEIQSELDSAKAHLIQNSTRSSPTMSTNGSFNDTWPDEVFGESSMLSRGNLSLYDSMRQGGSATAVMESLQAQLKQREGEVVQLQMEIAALERVRDNMTVELARLTNKVDALESANEEMKEVTAKLADLEQKYHTMLAMYGEKVEEAEELRLDLLDVKDMYKAQIEDLLRGQK